MARALTPAVQNVINAAVQTYALPEYTQDQHRGLASAAIAPRIVIAHFLMGAPMTQRNDSTDGTSLFLHGNRIAWWAGPRGTPFGAAGELHVTDAGWATPTTRSRLRLLPGVCRVSGMKRGELYGHAVRGGWWNGADWTCWRNLDATPDEARLAANRLPQPERKGVDCRDGTAPKRGWQSYA